MKEMPYEMLPLAVETELSRDWTLLCDKYWKFKSNAMTLCLNAREFPTSRQTRFISSRTGLEWYMICACPEQNAKSAYYTFYTPYTNPKGKKGCYCLSESDCEKMTPHFLDRVRTRYLHKHGIFPNTLAETMEAFCRYITNGENFLFISTKTGIKYMVLNQGIAIVDVAGNGMVTYITFISFDMLLSFQTPYKRIVERMYELYNANHRRWDMDRFERIIYEEGLTVDDEPLRQIKTKPRRKFTEPSNSRSWLQGMQSRNYDRAMKQIGDNAAELWTSTSQRPGTTSWIAPEDMAKGVEELLKQRSGK